MNDIQYQESGQSYVGQNTIQQASGNEDAKVWYDSIQDKDLKGYIQNKAWKDPVDVVTGYKNLEKLVGTEKIPMPKDEKDNDGWSRVYDALGRPKDPEAYDLPVPEGIGTEFASEASKKFHELGILKKQGQGLAEWWNATQEKIAQQEEARQEAASLADLDALKKEWGNNYDSNLEASRRAARILGLKEEELGGMMDSVGTKRVFEIFHKIGSSIGEHNFVSGNESVGAASTKTQAISKISELRGNKEWRDRYLSGDKGAVEEFTRLNNVAYGSGR